MTAATRAVLAVSIALAGALCVGDAASHPVVLVEDGTAYAAWGEDAGARAGRRAVLRDGAGTVIDTLVVIWARGAIAALGPVAARAGTAMTIDPLAAAEGEPAVRGALRVPLGAEAETVDPLFVTTLAEKQLATQMYSGLVRLDSTLAPRPSLALAWSAEAGGRHVFRLDPEARFHSGRPIRAIDVQATLERALSPAAAAPRVEELAAAIDGGAAYHAGRAAALRGVRVVDSLTVAITAARPGGGALLVAQLATPAAFVVPAGTPPSPMEERAMLAAQSGPFRLTGVTGRVATFLAAPGRAGGPASLDLVFLPSPSEQAIEFELGRLDIVSPPEAIARRLLGRPGARPAEVSVDEASTYYLGFDTRRPFLSVRANRRALAGLIDRALAVRVLVPGRGRLARGLLPPVFGIEAQSDTAWMLSRAAAERIAARNFAGKAPPLSFWVPQGSEVGLRIAEFVVAAWKRSGLTATIVERPWAAFQKGIAEGKADVFYWSWYADGPDPVAFVAAMVEGARRGEGGNRTHYRSSAVDRALAEARAAATPRAQGAALRRAERLALADAPLVPMFHGINVTLVRPGVRGLVPDPLGAPRYDTVEVR